MTDEQPERPVQLTLAAALVGLQGLALIGFTAVELLNLVGERLEVGLSVAVFFGAYGAALIACAWGLTQVRAWARGPVLLTQLIELGIAWNLRDLPGLAIPLALLAAATLALVVQPVSTLALAGEREEPTA